MVKQKLISLWVCLLLMATLCPGAQYAYSKRGWSFKGKEKDDSGKGSPSKGREKDDSGKGSPSKGRGLSKQGMKWAGAAAAGVLGGTGLGFLGKPKHGSEKHYGHKTTSSEKDQRLYYVERHGSSKQAFVRAAAPAPVTNTFVTLRYVVPLLITAWIRDM
ncbi:hypothetical protein GBF38_009831 [Nibea albiflora]|uniref:Uncharacterized protein n=1 Tax=Nibea albiflora TaxID=240163 RepID=A0ACB7FCA9_NIBAL|nr:hypothetical protein GBF38_009831 [Nibea albiflora]